MELLLCMRYRPNVVVRLAAITVLLPRRARLLRRRRGGGPGQQRGVPAVGRCHGDGRRRRAPRDAERGDGVPLLPSSDPHLPAGGRHAEMEIS